MGHKVFRTGNSLAVTIPANFTSSVGVRPGDRVLVREEPERARIVYQFSGAQQLPLGEGFFKRGKKKK